MMFLVSKDKMYCLLFMTTALSVAFLSCSLKLHDYREQDCVLLSNIVLVPNTINMEPYDILIAEVSSIKMSLQNAGSKIRVNVDNYQITFDNVMFTLEDGTIFKGITTFVFYSDVKKSWYFKFDQFPPGEFEKLIKVQIKQEKEARLHP